MKKGSHGKKHTKKFTAGKILLYSVITLLLFLSWLGSTLFIIKVAAIAYFGYRFMKWATGGFKCFYCLKHTTLTFVIMLLLTGILPGKFYLGAILILWLEALL